MGFLTPQKWSAGPTRRFSWCTCNGWACQQGRRTGRQPATRGARRASRSPRLVALATPCSPYASPYSRTASASLPASLACCLGPKRPLQPATWLLCASLPELLVLDRSVLPTQVQIGALLLLLRLLWLPDLSERLQVCCVLLWLLCSAVLERQKRSEFEFRVVDLFLYSAVSLAATRCVMLPAD